MRIIGAGWEVGGSFLGCQLDPLHTFVYSKAPASGDLRAVKMETEMGVGHERALKQYMMVRDGAVGQTVPMLQKSWWVWAEVRRNSTQFQWFGAQAW